jgi:hypothetical protein
VLALDSPEILDQASCKLDSIAFDPLQHAAPIIPNLENRTRLLEVLK